ncbi:MAG: diguanylate cyclase [Candidatus Competibacteraceae bacterium]
MPDQSTLLNKESGRTGDQAERQQARAQLTLPNKKTRETAFDHQALYAIGLQHVQRLASHIWNDYNIHDPGITILELLCYALTDLSYRASLPIEDLLVSGTDNAGEMKQQFPTARQILPNRPLTLADYRKLLIDIKGVKNAWLRPASLSYYADTKQEKLQHANDPKLSKVEIRGLYDVTIEYMDSVNKDTVLGDVRQRLQENRNLCEDFNVPTEVGTQDFVLYARLELAPTAGDVAKIKAEILFQVQQYLAPPIRSYTLSEMLERRKADGNHYTADEIFDGPVLDCGFIDDDELAKAELRTEIRLSDIISLIMDIEGIQAVREIAINPKTESNKWRVQWLVPVQSGKKAQLDWDSSSLEFYKRNIFILVDNSKFNNYYAELVKAEITKAETKVKPADNDFDVPLGTCRNMDYYSFQNHFPAMYGLSEAGLSDAESEKRKALAYQLKAYLLFFDQIMANYFAPLNSLRDLFSIDSNLSQTYFYQVVKSFAEYAKIYKDANNVEELMGSIEDKDGRINFDRRNRFLDHLIARFAERLNDFAYTMYSIFGSGSDKIVKYKCEFLRDYPEVGKVRALAYNYSIEKDVWDTANNISGLERRLAKLLGIANYKRKNLSTGDEGMYLIENILLRPEPSDDSFLPIFPDPNNPAELDPYSYRIHIILPAYGSRFSKVEFRNFAEAVIREETPAHIFPKICWISNEENMATLQEKYRNWILLKASKKPVDKIKLKDFIDQLFK